ncbi:MAG: alpha/beta hydrolase [Hyphomonadaceae bacterium]|nr:alpha/beta hydrolase [Hyphomonadaceae bacterium]
MTLETYDPLIETFASHFRVIVVELPAMGFSVASEDFGFGFGETNDELTKFLSAVAGERAIYAFSCVAGLAAIDIAVRSPALCSHLALIQTGDVAAFARWKALRDPKRILAKPVLGQLAMKRLAAERMPMWYALSVGKREMIAGFCQCAAESFRHGAQWSLASAYQCYMDDRQALSPPTQPLLSLWGEADRSHTPENQHSIKRLAPHAECVSFPELGHTPELEDPERVLGAIIAFRERVRA